jgi:hypothetical protein
MYYVHEQWKHIDCDVLDNNNNRMYRQIHNSLLINFHVSTARANKTTLVAVYIFVLTPVVQCPSHPIPSLQSKAKQSKHQQVKDRLS